MAGWIGQGFQFVNQRLTGDGGDEMDNPTTVEELREVLENFQLEQLELTREYQRSMEANMKELEHWKELASADGRTPPPYVKPTRPENDVSTGEKSDGQPNGQLNSSPFSSPFVQEAVGAQLEKLIQVNADREVRLKRFSVSTKKLSAEKTDLMQKVQELEEAVKAANYEGMQKTKTIEDLVDEYSRVVEELQTMESTKDLMVSELSTEKQELTSRVNDYKDKLAFLTESADMLENMGANNNTNAEMEKLRQDLKVSQDSALKSKRALDELIASQEVNQASKLGSEAEAVKVLEGVVRELEAKLKAAEETLEAEKLALTKQVAGLQAELEACAQESSEMEERAQTQVAQVELQMAQLRQKHTRELASGEKVAVESAVALARKEAESEAKNEGARAAQLHANQMKDLTTAYETKLSSADSKLRAFDAVVEQTKDAAKAEVAS